MFFFGIISRRVDTFTEKEEEYQMRRDTDREINREP